MTRSTEDIFAYFIDYEMASNRVRHSKLLNILQQIQQDEKEITIIENLC